jgi:hypothetical protein
MRNGSQILGLRLGAVGALTLACALCVSARAMQDAAGSTAAHSTSTKKTASAPTTHKSTASSGTRSGSSSKTHTSSSKTHTTASRKHSSRKTARVRGQQKIDPERAEAIQEALIREHYLTGTPAGTWNEESESAMRKFQADNGWQSIVVPDSRALIKLGLGPANDHLLNPESAMTTVPDPPKADPAPTTSHSASPTSNPAVPAATPASTSPQSATPSPQ